MSDVSMITSDNNGEISASVDETNRVREQLGLKPLAEGAEVKVDEAAVNGAERRAAAAKDDAEEAMRDKLETARRQRLLHQKLSGKSLGEMLAGDEMDSAAAWVSKSRTQEEARKERRKEAKAARKPKPAARQAAIYDELDEAEQELGASQVAGVTVGHAASDFKDGQSEILTLADKDVLDEDEQMLENVNMAEDWRRERAKEMATTGGKYNPYGTDGDGVGVGGALLSKYDDDFDGARKTMVLDAAGSVDEAKAKKLAAIKARLAASSAAAAGGGGSTAYDLSSVGEKASAAMGGGSDYQTVEEAAAFKKPAAGGKAKKMRRKKKEKAAALDYDELARIDAAENGAADHGSRADRADRGAAKRDRAEEAAEAKRARFDTAVARATEKADARLRDDPDRPAPTEDVAMADAEAEAAEEEAEAAEVDAELYAALARARRIGVAKVERRGEDDAAAAIAKRVAASDAAREKAGQGERAGEGGVFGEGGIEFSETGEFCQAVRPKEEMEQSELPSAILKKQQAKAEAKKKKEEEEDDEDDDEERERDEDDDEDEEGAQGDGLEGVREKSASGGLAAALSIARGRGMIGEESVSSGRMFDQKGAGLHSYTEDGVSGKEPSFHLDYYDEWGRKMSQKEAFRHLSWKFHGKAPSKKRKEKRMLELEKQRQGETEDKAMDYMHALQAAQQTTKSAHVVLTGIHAIKPSEIAPKAKAAPDGQKKKKVKKGL